MHRQSSCCVLVLRHPISSCIAQMPRHPTGPVRHPGSVNPAAHMWRLYSYSYSQRALQLVVSARVCRTSAWPYKFRVVHLPACWPLTQQEDTESSNGSCVSLLRRLTWLGTRIPVRKRRTAARPGETCKARSGVRLGAQFTEQCTAISCHM